MEVRRLRIRLIIKSYESHIINWINFTMGSCYEQRKDLWIEFEIVELSINMETQSWSIEHSFFHEGIVHDHVSSLLVLRL